MMYIKCIKEPSNLFRENSCDFPLPGFTGFTGFTGFHTGFTGNPTGNPTGFTGFLLEST
jgi:hypothetical protein